MYVFKYQSPPVILLINSYIVTLDYKGEKKLKKVITPTGRNGRPTTVSRDILLTHGNYCFLSDNRTARRIALRVYLDSITTQSLTVYAQYTITLG